MCSAGGDAALPAPGFPIRKSPDRSLVADSPGLIAGSYVLHRLLVPRHSPCALINLATTDDARVHCAVLKIRAVPVRTPPHPRRGEPVQRDGSTPVPSGPNSVLDQAVTAATLPVPRDRTNWVERRSGRITSAPHMSCHLGTFARDMALDAISVETTPVAP